MTRLPPELMRHAVIRVRLAVFALNAPMNFNGDVSLFGDVKDFFPHATQEPNFSCAEAWSVRNLLGIA
jgi:hypothetical protein